MFKQDNQIKGSPKGVETIIGPSVKVEGDFAGDGDVIVEGVVVGNLKTKNYLKIGAEAKVQAEINADSAYIAGEVIGNITLNNELELTSTAKIKGDIVAGLISIEKGAKVNGKLTMDSSKKIDAGVNKIKD